MDKKVSVIIPCFNKGKYVTETINSVLAQTYKNIEIIIVNDGSTDNSSQIINQFITDKSNIKFIDNNENKGVVYSRNSAIDLSEGEYILPLDADDTIEPTYIEKAAKILDENKQIGIVYCKAKYMGTQNEEWKLPEYTQNTFLYKNCIFCSALFRKSDFIRAGKYKENAERSWEDWDLWLSFIELGLIPYQINEILFNYRKCEEGSRNEYSNISTSNARKVIFKNHLDLYMNNSNFVDNCFNANLLDNGYENLQAQFNQEITGLQHEVKSLSKKRNKYKKLLKILGAVIIIETLLFVTLVWFVR